MSTKDGIYYDDRVEEMGKHFQRIMTRQPTAEEIEKAIEEADGLDYGKEE